MLSWTDSTFHFLVEQWKDNLPPGCMIKEASIDQPFEEDACQCHFVFINDGNANACSNLALKFQWFIGDRSLSNFTAIPGATEQVNYLHCYSCACAWASESFYIFHSIWSLSECWKKIWLGILAKAWWYRQNSESGMHCYVRRDWISIYICYVLTCFTRYALLTLCVKMNAWY